MTGKVSLKGKSAAAFLGFKGRARASTFFRFAGTVQYIRPGAQFRRVRQDDLVETARVLGVATDPVGIPHIRYEVVFERQQRRVLDGRRMLSLQSFADTYRESVEPAGAGD